MDKPINEMTGDELVSYLHILSARQAEYSRIKVQLTEELAPIQKEMAQKKSEITAVTERQRQVRIEIAACKYAIRAEANE